MLDSSVPLATPPFRDVSRFPCFHTPVYRFSHAPVPTGTSPYRIPPKAPGLREDVFIVLATDTNGEAAASVLKIDDPTISPPTTSAPGLARFQNKFRGYLNLTSPADIFGSGAIVPPSHYDTTHTHTHNTHIHTHTHTHTHTHNTHIHTHTYTLTLTHTLTLTTHTYTLILTTHSQVL